MKLRIPPTVGDGPIPAPAPEVTPDLAFDEAARPARNFHPWRWLAALVLAPVLLSHAVVIALRWVPPPVTAFMLQSPTQPVLYKWVPAKQIAEVARKAVVASEDQKFRDHGGFDLEAIGKALEHNERSRRKRGASTISQQVAKNVFLWPGHSWVRKGLEVYATLLIEWVWGKDRILEVYLNVAEFGPGLYGVEAAAQKFFGKPAARLSPEEAARLAAVLPSPRKWRAGNPGPYVQARTEWILGQMGYRAVPEPEPELPPGEMLEGGTENSEPVVPAEPATPGTTPVDSVTGTEAPAASESQPQPQSESTPAAPPAEPEPEPQSQAPASTEPPAEPPAAPPPESAPPQ